MLLYLCLLFCCYFCYFCLLFIIISSFSTAFSTVSGKKFSCCSEPPSTTSTLHCQTVHATLRTLHFQNPLNCTLLAHPQHNIVKQYMLQLRTLHFQNPLNCTLLNHPQPVRLVHTCLLTPKPPSTSLPCSKTPFFGSTPSPLPPSLPSLLARYSNNQTAQTPNHHKQTTTNKHQATNHHKPAKSTLNSPYPGIKSKKRGLISADRNNKATLLLTIPPSIQVVCSRFLLFNISLAIIGPCTALPPAVNANYDARPGGLFVIYTQKRAVSSLSSMDSDLEAFSRNPTHGSFAALAFQLTAKTNYAKKQFLSY